VIEREREAGNRERGMGGEEKKDRLSKIMIEVYNMRKREGER
jgi:hypothetical protein